MPQIETLYWDSCIFIAWLKDEARPNNEMDGVYECVSDVTRGRARIITSVLTKTEVFESDLDQETADKYSRLLLHRSCQLVDNDLRVSTLARELREHYAQQSRVDGQPVLTVADAVHLATAIHYRTAAFWTFDDGKHGGRSLLSLNGDVAGHPLVITRPVAKQFRLGL